MRLDIDDTVELAQRLLDDCANVRSNLAARRSRARELLKDL
jgi:hypothetical protein